MRGGMTAFAPASQAVRPEDRFRRRRLSGAPGVRLVVDSLPSPIGPIFIACTDDALCVVDFDGNEERMHTHLRRRFAEYELFGEPNPLGVTALLERYFAGDLGAIANVRVDAGGTPYQCRVWNELRTIPCGQTRTYAQIAARLGNTHARAVGQANSLNPVAIVVPCHRVIGANAALTGYAGGLSRKRWLLDHESHNGILRLPL